MRQPAGVVAKIGKSIGESNKPQPSGLAAGPKADITQRELYVRFGPQVDIRSPPDELRQVTVDAICFDPCHLTKKRRVFDLSQCSSRSG
jgi:hypothetical protein